jgi:hypothetical protein
MHILLKYLKPAMAVSWVIGGAEVIMRLSCRSLTHRKALFYHQEYQIIKLDQMLRPNIQINDMFLVKKGIPLSRANQTSGARCLGCTGSTKVKGRSLNPTLARARVTHFLGLRLPAFPRYRHPQLVCIPPSYSIPSRRVKNRKVFRCTHHL